MMKSEGYGSLTWRQIRPFGLLPRKYITPLLNQDPEAIAFAKDWIDRNGRIILFTQGKAKGWEKVWVSDEGVIYMDDEDYDPTISELDTRLRQVEAPDSLLGEGVGLKTKLSYLKKHERPL